MSKRRLMGLVALFSAGLPIMTAGAQQAGQANQAKQEENDASLETGVALCVRMRELIFECKEEFADVFVARRNPPPEQRAALRKTALAEITADGSGPLPPRRQACEGMARGGKNLGKDWLTEAQKTLDSCAATKDCKARVPCVQELMKPPGRGKPTK